MQKRTILAIALILLCLPSASFAEDKGGSQPSGFAGAYTNPQNGSTTFQSALNVKFPDSKWGITTYVLSPEGLVAGYGGAFYADKFGNTKLFSSLSLGMLQAPFGTLPVSYIYVRGSNRHFRASGSFQVNPVKPGDSRGLYYTANLFWRTPLKGFSIGGKLKRMMGWGPALSYTTPKILGGPRVQLWAAWAPNRPESWSKYNSKNFRIGGKILF